MNETRESTSRDLLIFRSKIYEYLVIETCPETKDLVKHLNLSASILFPKLRFSLISNGLIEKREYPMDHINGIIIISDYNTVCNDMLVCEFKRIPIYRIHQKYISTSMLLNGKQVVTNVGIDIYLILKFFYKQKNNAAVILGSEEIVNSLQSFSLDYSKEIVKNYKLSIDPISVELLSNVKTVRYIYDDIKTLTQKNYEELNKVLDFKFKDHLNLLVISNIFPYEFPQIHFTFSEEDNTAVEIEKTVFPSKGTTFDKFPPFPAIDSTYIDREISKIRQKIHVMPLRPKAMNINQVEKSSDSQSKEKNDKKEDPSSPVRILKIDETNSFILNDDIVTNSMGFVRTADGNINFCLTSHDNNDNAEYEC